jgi:hypothetical protein
VLNILMFLAPSSGNFLLFFKLPHFFGPYSISSHQLLKCICNMQYVYVYLCICICPFWPFLEKIEHNRWVKERERELEFIRRPYRRVTRGLLSSYLGPFCAAWIFVCFQSWAVPVPACTNNWLNILTYISYITTNHHSSFVGMFMLFSSSSFHQTRHGHTAHAGITVLLMSELISKTKPKPMCCFCLTSLSLCCRSHGWHATRHWHSSSSPQILLRASRQKQPLEPSASTSQPTETASSHTPYIFCVCVVPILSSSFFPLLLTPRPRYHSASVNHH